MLNRQLCDIPGVVYRIILVFFICCIWVPAAAEETAEDRPLSRGKNKGIFPLEIRNTGFDDPDANDKGILSSTPAELPLKKEDRRDEEVMEDSAEKVHPDEEMPKREENPGLASFLPPGNLVHLPAHGRNPYIILVEKKTQMLRVYQADNPVEMVYETSCSTGKNSGAKQKSGDAKTPVGVYFFENKHKKKELSDIYGVLAFPTDYPNVVDICQGKTGSAIWLHGTNKKLEPNDSNGCVALENQDLLQVADYITLNRTPFVIVEETSPPLKHKDRETELKRFLDMWKWALESGSYHDYLSFYSPGYLPDLRFWPMWQKLRHQKMEKEKTGRPAVRLSDFMILEASGVFVACFEMHLEGQGKNIFAGFRKLFIQDSESGFAIIGDAYQPPVFEKKTLPLPHHPLIAAANMLQKEKHPEIKVEDIEKMVKTWLSAWSSGDMEAYGRFYTDDFMAMGMNKDAWISHKERLSRKYEYIRITHKNLRIDNNGKKPAVSFIQNYESSGYKARGMKKLILKQENGKWKIYRELWKKI